MAEPILSAYADFAAMLTELPVILRSARRMRGLSLRAAAQEIGVNFNTVGRVENGTECDTGTLLAILRWLDDPTRLIARNYAATATGTPTGDAPAHEEVTHG